MRYFLIVPLLLTLAGCTPSSVNSQEADTPKAYRTTQPSLLYFKNMRSANYQQEEQKATRITSYTHNRLRDQHQDSLGFTPQIASDWLNDRAFLIPQWAGNQVQPSMPLTILYETDSLVLASPTPMAQTDWLLQVHELMQAGEQLRLKTGQQDAIPFLQDPRLRSTFSTVVKDYLRLTEHQ